MFSSAREKNIEKFLNYLIEGMTQRQAYYKAFTNSKKWKEKTVDEKASRLFADDKIRARFNEKKQKFETELKKMQEQEEKNSIMTKVEMIKKLNKAFKMALGEEEIIVTPCTFGVYQDEKHIRETDLKAVANISEKIAKIEGWIIDKTEHSGKVKIENNDMSKFTDEELRRIADGEFEG